MPEGQGELAPAGPGRPALFDPGIGADLEGLERAAKRGGIEPAQRQLDLVADLAEQRAAQVDLRDAAADPYERTAAGVGVANEPACDASASSRRRRPRAIEATVQSAAYSPARVVTSPYASPSVRRKPRTAEIAASPMVPSRSPDELSQFS